MEPEVAFGIILKKYRKKNNLSQEKLSEASDLDRTYISLLERGQRQPSLKTILSISKVFGVSATDIISKVEERIKQQPKS